MCTAKRIPQWEIKRGLLEEQYRRDVALSDDGGASPGWRKLREGLVVILAFVLLLAVICGFAYLGGHDPVKDFFDWCEEKKAQIG